MIDVIAKWLSLFGEPWVFLLNTDKKDYKTKIDRWNYRWLENSYDINQSSPLWLFFTPNWNFGKINQTGEKIKRSDTLAERYVSAIYIDLDKKMSSYKDKSDEEYLDYIIDCIEKRDFLVHYIMKSGWWYHLYNFVHPTQRYEIGEFLTKWRWDNRKILFDWLASIFDGWDAASHSISKLMRLPFSKHWKTAEPIDTKLYRVIRKVNNENWKNKARIKLVEVKKPEDITLDGFDTVENDIPFTTLAWIEHFIKQQQPVSSVWKNATAVQRASALQINQLDIVEVISRLEKYPRLNADWLPTIFKTDWNRISIVVDWTLTPTDWYKINRAKNYVNNFSLAEHPRDERPAWPVYVFLVNYFYKDLNKMAEFLKAEFNIDFFAEWSIMRLSTDKWVISFNTDWVYYIKAKEWEESQEKLFDTPFIIKWAVRTNFDSYWESEDKNLYTIISLLDRDEDEPENMIINFTEDRKKFNRTYWKKWLTFLKWEYDLLDFYSAIKKAVKEWVIKQYDYLYLNWYYKDYYLEWDVMYDTKGNKINTNELPVIIDTQEVKRYEWTKEITMSEFWEKLRQLYTDRESMVAYITFLALAMWDKFWKERLDWNLQQVLLPALFLAWITKSWKSTLINLMLNWFGLSSDCKKYSVKWTTLQPLKQWATDDFITHREEFTGNIWQDRETIIRDVLNKWKTARWNMDWSNVYYIYRASLIIDWENLPESESVINRCVCIPMTLQDRIWTQELIRSFDWLTFKKDFLTELYNIDLNKVKKDFQAAQDRCINYWITDRNSMIYAFVLCVNDWFNIYLETDLVTAIKENLELSASVDNSQSPLSTLLSDIITKNKIRPTQQDLDNWYNIIVPLPREIINTRKFDLVSIIKKYWSDKIKISWANLVIFLDINDASELNKELYNTIILFRSSFVNGRSMTLDWFE